MIASIERGDGLGLGPDRTLPGPALVPVTEVDGEAAAAVDAAADGEAALEAGLCSRTGGGVSGDSGGGEGRGDL